MTNIESNKLTLKADLDSLKGMTLEAVRKLIDFSLVGNTQRLQMFGPLEH